MKYFYSWCWIYERKERHIYYETTEKITYDSKAGVMLWLAELFHKFPKVNFAFHSVESKFDLTNKDYVEALIIYATCPVILCVLLFIVIIGVWSVKCCTKGNTSKPKSDAKAIASGLIACLGVSMNEVVYGIGDLGNELTKFGEKVQLYNYSLNSELLPAMRTLQNELQDAKVLLNDQFWKNFSMMIEVGVHEMDSLVQFGSDLTTLENSKYFIQRLEFERWMLCVILFAIVLIVNLWGLIGSCNLSGKGIMFFSGAGIITFLVVWALVAFAFVLCLGVSDFCLDPYPSLERFMNDDFSLMLRYFRKCVENKDSVLEGTPLGRLLQQTKDMHIFLTRFFMNLKLEGKETSHPEIWTAISGIHDAYAEATKSAVSLYNLVSCSNMREEYKTIRYGLCNESLSANSVLLMALTAFGIIQFVTLLIVSSSWKAFQPRMHPYVDAEGNDPLLSRADAAAVHTDFYGSHVFNPRSRLAASMSVESCNADNTMGGFRNTPPPAVSYDYGISSLRPLLFCLLITCASFERI
ncbi:Protein tweety -like protein 1 [Trichinella zimbabwensis]|uniref:Protein tweety homolog n=1 Tax=Trichinella zimbabwensis TaxID=268475 RepID=A0A0V1GVU8_9BILA|nr:Protein tweety -like protein 1 [Trichinella zimbabwensis]KRZ02300.1 Protein tweety -like protein 1 [Trichinella zimbabwensis]KRZ02301.1 Protein tweety -like protein 1 [Trichinella zimbabwensis]